MTVLRYTVPPENEGCKLGLFLRMQGVTAGLIKSVKYDGDGFYADDQPIRTNEPVHAGQCIRFALPPEQETSVTPQPVPFSIAYEDDFAAVLNKPAGIAVHPTLNYPDGTLANGWLYHLQQRGGERHLPPGKPHRQKHKRPGAVREKRLCRTAAGRVCPQVLPCDCAGYNAAGAGPGRSAYRAAR